MVRVVTFAIESLEVGVGMEHRNKEKLDVQTEIGVPTVPAVAPSGNSIDACTMKFHPVVRTGVRLFVAMKLLDRAGTSFNAS